MPQRITIASDVAPPPLNRSDSFKSLLQLRQPAILVRQKLVSRDWLSESETMGRTSITFMCEIRSL